VALAAERGEGRLLRLQAASQARGGRWQADLWQGREGPSRWARPLLPLGRGAGGGGLWLQGDRRWGGLDARAALRWLDGPVRSEDRSAWWWRLELAGRLRESGLPVWSTPASGAWTGAWPGSSSGGRRARLAIGT